jgi:hypothetical protein
MRGDGTTRGRGADKREAEQEAIMHTRVKNPPNNIDCNK